MVKKTNINVQFKLYQKVPYRIPFPCSKVAWVSIHNASRHFNRRQKDACTHTDVKIQHPSNLNLSEDVILNSNYFRMKL